MIIFFNDSIAQNSKEIYVDEDNIYILSGRRCLPYFQDCSSLIKLNYEGEIIDETLLPDLDVGNDNALLYYDGTFIITGHRNRSEQDTGFFFYQVSLGGEILNYKHIPLQDRSSINYASAINYLTSDLYICGASDANGENPEINVDGIIAKYNLISNKYEIEQYDNDNIALDIYDIQTDTDSTLVFLSRRRGVGYISGHLDWVVEKIYPNGSREEIHKTENIKSSDVNLPEFAVLSNGNMVFHLGDDNHTTIKFRLLDSNGNFLFDTEFQGSFFPNSATALDLQPLSDGGFLIVGKYYDRTDPEEHGNENNGMLLKIDENGEVEWLHHYRHFHPETKEYRESSLSEAREMENGDIVSIGYVTGGYTTDLWLLKVNSDGCLSDGECDELATAVEDVKISKKYITIYPNPIVAGQSINVLYNKNEINPTSVTLQSMDGRIVSQVDNDRVRHQISTDGLLPGLYVLSILEDRIVILSEEVLIR